MELRDLNPSQAERERFLAEYRTALAARPRDLALAAPARAGGALGAGCRSVSKPGYAKALAEARLGAGQYVTLGDVIIRRQQHS